MGRAEKSELAREVLDLPKMNGVPQALQKEVNVTTTGQCVTILTRGMMAGMSWEDSPVAFQFGHECFLEIAQNRLMGAREKIRQFRFEVDTRLGKNLFCF